MSETFEDLWQRSAQNVDRWYDRWYAEYMAISARKAVAEFKSNSIPASTPARTQAPAPDLLEIARDLI